MRNIKYLSLLLAFIALLFSFPSEAQDTVWLPDTFYVDSGQVDDTTIIDDSTVIDNPVEYEVVVSKFCGEGDTFIYDSDMDGNAEFYYLSFTQCVRCRNGSGLISLRNMKGEGPINEGDSQISDMIRVSNRYRIKMSVIQTFVNRPDDLVKVKIK